METKSFYVTYKRKRRVNIDVKYQLMPQLFIRYVSKGTWTLSVRLIFPVTIQNQYAIDVISERRGGGGKEGV